MSQVHVAGRDIASDQVRIPAFERRGRRDSSSENAIAKARSEAFDLALYRFEAIGCTAVGNVTVSPRSMVIRRSAGGIEEGWLDKYDERSVGGEVALRSDDLLERASEVNGGSA